MTFRRALLASSIIALAASAVGALAFASERSGGFARVLSGRSPWSGRGFTPVPEAAANAHRAAASLLRQGTDSAAGTYCRFPENGQTIPGTSSPQPGAAPSASETDLVLQGQSLVTGAAPAAICVGEPVPSVTPSPGSGIIP